MRQPLLAQLCTEFVQQSTDLLLPFTSDLRMKRERASTIGDYLRSQSDGSREEGWLSTYWGAGKRLTFYLCYKDINDFHAYDSSHTERQDDLTVCPVHTIGNRASNE